jgi:hypothetical protein
MTITDGKRGARDYFWFALALIVVLIGFASRASAADAAATDPLSRTAAQSHGVHDPRHPLRPRGNGVRHLALEVGVDQAVQVHHVLQGLHVD